MKYVKTYEFFGKQNKYYSIDDLFDDVDSSKIKIEDNNYSKSYMTNIVEYEKNEINYKIKLVESVSRELGVETRIYFYVNDEFKRVQRRKLIKLYYFLKDSYSAFREDLKKYNL